MTCRIARRVALTWAVENRCVQAVNAQTLATKVFHLSLQSFPFGGRAARRRWVAERGPVTVAGKRTGSAPRRAGVRLSPQDAATRRLAWHLARRTTPFTTPSLPTNDKVSEAAR